MKTLRAFTCSLAALTFSAIAHAAPVQHQITATHNTEKYGNDSDVAASDYFFNTAGTVTLTFSYDSTAPAIYTNIGDPTGGDGRASGYTQALSNFSLEVNGHSIYAPETRFFVIDSQNTAPTSQDKIAISALTPAASNNISNQLTFGDFRLFNISILFSGPTNMLSDQSLPNTLTELNSSLIKIHLSFEARNYSVTRYAVFEEGAISQVPLPTSALFFLSGLIGLGANIFKKAKK